MLRSARLIYKLRRFDHVCNALMSLNWLRIPERIQFKLAYLIHRVLHGNAPEYLGPFIWQSDVPSRSPLLSASSNHLLILMISPVRRSTVGAGAFTVSGPALWNSLASDITSIGSLPVLFRRLKKYFFQSFVSRCCSVNTYLSWPRSFSCCTWSR